MGMVTVPAVSDRFGQTAVRIGDKALASKR